MSYKEELTSVVDDFTSKSYMFTSWDVTQEARQREAIGKRSHNKIKHIVSDIYEAGEMYDYSRTLLPLPGVSIQPWIYHPDDVNAYDYLASLSNSDNGSDDDSDNQSVTIPNNSTVGTLTPTTISLDNLPTYLVESSEKRLCVPKEFLNRISVSPGDRVIVDVSTNNQSKIYNLVTPFVTGILLTVDTRGTIRLSQSVLETSSNGGCKFKIVFDPTDNSVLVKSTD